ncbi:MAG TPA: bifunctional [glutamine synthetase] adenylyltransferase/[glutamine synthetase]-adenylyl-L-tyrosine phosphorylase, partial [Aestuariivirgaceae bacterium]|nr:bifunctional [glutamine synthetase] adenylyltransferase/[glutamine synthetase]-adenylyl-L-tyrosine phosphorylase [Aestuariivirgaceae bacterium]
KATVDYLLAAAFASRQLSKIDAASPGAGSGYVVLAMGKHGAHELNFSSDIDLIVFYDSQSPAISPGIEPAKFFVRLTKQLVHLLQVATEDGYVYRVDLRLRPDPRATQIAIAIEAAAIYYENMGQNWERAAMIKARPIAGDIALGEGFLTRLNPYVWRKYLDFSAIADIQSLKRQIHAVKGHSKISVRGHNIKLGRGGIREIEFFVQTQQLIAGGRNPSLRGRKTLEMLDALAAAGWITRRTADELKQDYCFFRRVENRIQMVADEQTHIIPADDEGFVRLSAFSGFTSSAVFEEALRSAFSRVQAHYSALFEDAPALGSESGSLVFTGGEDDPETIATLERMGFRQPSEISATIRGWHFGRYAATRSARAKEILTEIMPALLKALSTAGDADRAFMAFDRFLSGLSAGVQIFSMLKANPQLLELITRVLGIAPRLAEELSRRPKVLDAVLDHRFFDRLPDRGELERLTAGLTPPASRIEETLDQARIIGKEQMFRIGVRILSETVSAEEAGLAYSNLADVMIGRLLSATRNDLALRHGRVAGEKIAVIAMGKLGGQEMTAGSDLDLILLYDMAHEAEHSDGKRPLSVMQYFGRTTQRLIAALSSPTPEGVLYDVDLRLRPSGNKGPVASHIRSFVAYHRHSAWTWERLALTRARVVAGDDEFCATVDREIAQALSQAPDAAVARADVVDMRRRMLSDIGSKGTWDLKHERGGLVEIEFIAQYLQIIHGAHPQILKQNTLAALAALAGSRLLASEDARILEQACRLYHRLTQLLRLCIAGEFRPDEAIPGLRQLLSSAAGAPDLQRAEALLADTQIQVAHLFDRIIGRP